MSMPNLPPAAPSVAVTAVSGTSATFRTSPFLDPDPGDVHAATRWVVDGPGYALDVTRDSGDLRSFTATGLEPGTAYTVAAEHRDASGGASGLSTPVEFTTLAPSACPAPAATRDALRSGLAWLTGMLAAHAAREVAYSRGGDCAIVRATFGEKLLRLDGPDGGVLEWTDIDFLIPTADLVLSGVPVEPARGDRIVVDGDRTYEVSPFGSEPPWRYADPHRSMVRIHAKRVAQLTGG